MRPLKLTMTAFGPYRDTEIIDFSVLEHRRLFVISGNTGAGKTSIFDAICFAFYGTASGEDRSDSRMLRSHFADEETHTAVEFEFAIGRRSYMVLRQMPHRKGSNKSETGGKAELYETTSGTAIPAVDRFIVSDVNVKLEAIIGLTKEQFSQIVMLPQGEFRKLLTSDTDNKEEILRRIFRTELYEKLENRFQQKNREMQDQLKVAKTETSGYMRQAEETLPMREESQLQRTLEQEVYSAGQITEALQHEVEYYSELAIKAEAQKSLLSVQLDEQELGLREAISLNNKYEELDKKSAQYEQLITRKGEYVLSEQRLALAERAAHLTPYEEQSVRAAADSEVKQKQLIVRRSELAAIEQSHAQVVQSFHGEEKREDERREAERELNKLIELAPIVQTLASQQQAIERSLQEEKGCAAKLDITDATLIQLREKKQAAGAQIKVTESETNGWQEKLDKLRQIEQQGKQLKRIIDVEKEISRFKQLEVDGSKALAKAKSEHDRLESIWVEGQASLLAVHLHDGKPCPVCGSENHPEKAVNQAQIPSREMLQQSKELLTVVESELMHARAQSAAASATREEGVAELAESGIAAARLEEQQGQLRQLWRELKEETDRLQLKAQQLPELKAQLEQLEQSLEKQLLDKELLQQQQQERIIKRTAQQTVLNKELDRIPENLRSSPQITAKLNEQRALSERLVASWKAAQEQLQIMSTRLAEHKAYVSQAEIQQSEAEDNKKAAQERQTAELLKAGFASAEHYREAALTVEAKDSLKKDIESYRSAVSLLNQQLLELRGELTGKQRIDINVLQEQHLALKQQLEQVLVDTQTALRTGQEAQRLVASISRSYENVKLLEGKLEEVMDVFHMLKGDNALKISFERSILIEFLEHILYAANVRLRDLSNGQFTLQRSDRLENRGKQSGLGLDVYDAYTGQNRDVKTLSGGEKFNASLCLALGMTDVIQSHQGGVTIEMMFIDEGFGSLDEESLQKAITALVDLQRAGRMIGVISHVQELKDAFPACLEVKKTKEGFSRTSITVK